MKHEVDPETLTLAADKLASLLADYLTAQAAVDARRHQASLPRVIVSQDVTGVLVASEVETIKLARNAERGVWIVTANWHDLAEFKDEVDARDLLLDLAAWLANGDPDSREFHCGEDAEDGEADE